jgi:cytoskeleton protein RodZ
MTHGVGTSWKAKREAMGKTLEQAAGDLRISRRYLAGIEEGNFRGWPERVFSSGFIRTYGKYLSEDPGPVLAEYERTVEDRQETETVDVFRPEWLERERQRGSRRTTFTVAAGVVLFAGLVLAWISIRSATRPPPLPPSAAAPAAVAPAAENAAKAEVPPAGADNAAAVLPAAENAAPAGAQSLPGGSPEQPIEPSVASVGGNGPLAGPFQLFLEASQQTWMMYSFDDGDPIDVTLYPGDKISIQAQRRIVLKLGNAGGVTGTLNGRRLPPFGESGQVRKVAFGQ